MAEAAKTKAPANAAWSAITVSLGLYAIRPRTNSKSNKIPGGIAGRTYPGSLDRETEKKATLPRSKSPECAEVVGVAISSRRTAQTHAAATNTAPGPIPAKSPACCTKWLGVVIQIGAETREVVLDDGFVEGLRIA